MTDFSYHEFSQQLSRLKTTLSPVWLVHGEEMLCQEAIGQLVTHLLPNDPNRLAYESLGGDTHFLAALEKIQTHSFFGTGKVVALLDARLFDTKKDFEKLIQRANNAYLKEKPDRRPAWWPAFWACLILPFPMLAMRPIGENGWALWPRTTKSGWGR